MTKAESPWPNSKVLRLFELVEEKLLCLLLATMIVLACLQILLRTAASGGLLWIDPLLRYLVLWSGLLGAVTATGQGKHIALDLFGQRLPSRLAPVLNLIVQLFSCLAAAGLTWAGWRFLAGEITGGGEGVLGVPLAVYNAIFPLSFALIAIKSALLLGFELRNLGSGSANAR